jgi:hypothetical protein
VVSVLVAQSFETPQQAVDTLIAAAEKFDEKSLMQIFGDDGKDILYSGEIAQDRQRIADFVVEAHEKKNVSIDPKSGNRPFLLVGPSGPSIARRGARNYSTAALAPMNLMPYKSAADTSMRRMRMRGKSVRDTTSTNMHSALSALAVNRMAWHGKILMAPGAPPLEKRLPRLSSRAIPAAPNPTTATFSRF